MLKFVIIFAAAAVCYGQTINNRYYLYSERTQASHAVIDTSAASMPTSFVAVSPVTILIHGHGESVGALFNRRVRIQLVAKEHNVIVVDWEALAGYSYANARSNVPRVAEQLTQFINWLAGLKTNTNDPQPLIQVNKLHLVGFGLGAHVAGIASRELIPQVGRITGLDPSGNGWGANSDRLKNSDATYVEVIHTDGSGLLANGIGDAIGTVNFYANGGNNQPGCLSHSCSHNRAWELFESSLEFNALVAQACASKAQMNLNNCRGGRLALGGIDDKTRQAESHIYRINTRRNYPF